MPDSPLLVLDISLTPVTSRTPYRTALGEASGLQRSRLQAGQAAVWATGERKAGRGV